VLARKEVSDGMKCATLQVPGVFINKELMLLLMVKSLGSSIAMDDNGSIGLAFACTGTGGTGGNIYPSIRYTGRRH